MEFIEEGRLDQLPGFAKRTRWFLKHRPDLAQHISYLARDGRDPGRRLLAIPSRERLRRVLAYVFDEREFLSPYGIRSLSRAYAAHPFVLESGADRYQVDYEPGESQTWLFGGNSNWRGPVWFPHQLPPDRGLGKATTIFTGTPFRSNFRPAAAGCTICSKSPGSSPGGW